MRPSGDRINRKDGHSSFSTLAHSSCDDREKECSLSKPLHVCFRKSTVHFCQVRHTYSFCRVLANQGFHKNRAQNSRVCWSACRGEKAQREVFARLLSTTAPAAAGQQHRQSSKGSGQLEAGSKSAPVEAVCERDFTSSHVPSKYTTSQKFAHTI